MIKSRWFWLLVTWIVTFGTGTSWVAVEGNVPFGNAVLVGAVAACVLTLAVARVGR